MKRRISEEIKNLSIQYRLQGMSSREISGKLMVSVPFLEKLFAQRSIRLSDELLFKIRSNSRPSPVKNGAKLCRGCGLLLDIKLFAKSNAKALKTGIQSKCRSCQSKKYSSIADIRKTQVKSWRAENPERRYQIRKAQYEGNIQKAKADAKAWSKANPGSNRARTALRRAARVRATPSWLTRDDKREIGAFYRSCPPGYEVDHIVPLKGKDPETGKHSVCGLHVLWNLQYLPRHVNRRKSNKMRLDPEVCHQKLRRNQTEEEDRKRGMPFGLKASEFVLNHEPFTKEHRDFIARYEWLGSVGFGVRWCFTARYHGMLAGVVLLSEPTAYSSFDMKIEALIQRGACASWAPINLNSRLVMFACRWMVQNTDKRMFVAYSDPTAGEIGTIYQACNFDYLGNSYGASRGYKLESGRVVGDRYFTRTSAMKKWAKQLGIPWRKEWCKPNGFQDVHAIPENVLMALRSKASNEKNKLERVQVQLKGKYAILLGKNKTEQKKLDRLKNWHPRPYPKRSH